MTVEPANERCIAGTDSIMLNIAGAKTTTTNGDFLRFAITRDSRSYNEVNKGSWKLRLFSLHNNEVVRYYTNQTGCVKENLMAQRKQLCRYI